jgi:protein TonB
MFEDSLVESGGRLKTKSKYWAIGALALNGGILFILILIPLLYPERCRTGPGHAACSAAATPTAAPASAPDSRLRSSRSSRR